MAAGRIVLPPYMPTRNRDGLLVDQARLTVYENETTVKATIYSDDGLTTPQANPVIANSSGQFPPIWAEAGTTESPVLYSLAIADASGASVGNPGVFDNWQPSVDGETAASALAEAAADAAAASAVDAEDAATVAEDALAEILAAAAAAPETLPLLNKANLNGGNVASTGNADNFRQAIEAVGEVELAASTGGALVGFIQSGTGAVARTVQAKLRETIVPEDFGAVGDGVTNDTTAIQNAISAADAAGIPLVWPDKTYRITSVISASITRLNWRGEGATILFDPASDQPVAVSLALSTGADHVMTGPLLIDANGKANRGIYFGQTAGDQSASLAVSDLSVSNIEMYATPAVASAGIVVFGGFKFARLTDCTVNRVMMRTGGGVPASRGVSGILVLQNGGVNGSYCLNTEIIRPVIRRVYNQDAAYQSDMDGIGVFAHPGVDMTLGASTLLVQDPDIKGCWGRDIKTQVGWTVVRNPISVRDEGPTGGIAHPAIDIQTGSGLVEGGDFLLDGIYAAYEGVRFQCDPSVQPMNSTWAGGMIRLVNGATADYIIASDPNTTGVSSMVQARGQTVNGTVSAFGLIRTNAAEQDFMRVEGVTVSGLDTAMIECVSKGGGSAPYRGVAHLDRCINLGTAKPMGHENFGVTAAQLYLSSTICTGFTDQRRYLGTFDSNDLFSAGDRASIEYPERFQTMSTFNNLWAGSRRLGFVRLLNGGSFTLPEHGYDGSYTARFFMTGADAERYAEVAVSPSAIVDIYSGTNAVVGTTSDPGSGLLRIWRSGSQIVVSNNSGSEQTILVEFFG